VKNLIYRLTRSILVKLGKLGWIENILRSIVYEVENREKTKPNSVVLDRYCNPDIGGYANIQSLTEADLSSPRFLTVSEYFDSHPMSAIDIGCAGGDFAARLAQKFPDHEYFGVDFNVDYAVQNFKSPNSQKNIENLTFYGGYFLEMDLPKADAAIFISTASCLLPIELSATFQKMSNNGVRHIIISEPWWWRQSIAPSDVSVESKHAKYVCWNHAYPGLLKHAGFEIVQFEKTIEKSNTERLFIVASKTK